MAINIGEGVGFVHSRQVGPVTQAGALARINTGATFEAGVRAQVSFNSVSSQVFGVKLAQESTVFTGLGTPITGVGWNDASRTTAPPTWTVDADLTDAQASPGSLLANTDIGGRSYPNAQVSEFLPPVAGYLEIGGTGIEKWILFLEDLPGAGLLTARVTLWIGVP